jgi:hypothetical protein
MERLNWAMLGVMGIVTALGLGTSTGAGKAKTNEEPLSVVVSSNVSNLPPCAACLKHASSTPVVTATPAATKLATDEPCTGNCQETGVCCDKSLSKKDGVVSIARTGELFEFAIPANKKPVASTAPVCEGDCPFSKKQEVVATPAASTTSITANVVCEGECCLSKKATATASATTTTDCPLAKAGEGLLNLTKNFVCEGGDCLAKPGHGKLTITAVEPASTQPEGLLNLLAAAEAAKSEEKPDGAAIGIVSGGFTLQATPTLNLTTGTLTLTGTADTKGETTRVVIAGQPNAKQTPAQERAVARATRLAAIETKMAQPWTLEFNDTPLTEVVEALQTKLGVPVLLDRRGLEDIAFDPATPLTAGKQPEIEAGEFLRGHLRNYNLTWMIPASNDRVLITSIQTSESMPINRLFDATDLIDENLGPDAIVERIQSLVEPPSWKVNGGNGELTVWQKGNRVSLLCSNTYWTQRAIAELLDDLRLNSGEAGGHAVLPAQQNPVAVLRRYELPTLLDVKDRNARQKLLTNQKQFFLTLLKDEPDFDPAVFEMIEFADQSLLLTKQSPVVHRRIQQTLKLLESQAGGAGGINATNVSQ